MQMNNIFCKSKFPILQSLFTFIFFFVSCSPTYLVKNHLQSIDPALILEDKNREEDLKPKREKKFVLAITDLLLTDDTNLGRSFSELYLTSISKNTAQSTNYLSLEEFMYNNNRNRFLIPLQIDTIDLTFDICLVLGHIGINKVLHIKKNQKCKKFSTTDLLTIKNRGYNFTLENKSEKTPKVTLILHPKYS